MFLHSANKGKFWIGRNTWPKLANSRLLPSRHTVASNCPCIPYCNAIRAISHICNALQEVMAFTLLQELPEELLDEVLVRVDRRAQYNLSLTSRWSYTHVAPFLWRDITLTDRHSCHEFEDGTGILDDHDDTPLIKILITLARYVRITLNKFVRRRYVTLIPYISRMPDSHYLEKLD
jgi:hypothetical protein